MRRWSTDQARALSSDLDQSSNSPENDAYERFKGPGHLCLPHDQHRGHSVSPTSHDLPLQPQPPPTRKQLLPLPRSAPHCTLSNCPRFKRIHQPQKGPLPLKLPNLFLTSAESTVALYTGCKHCVLSVVEALTVPLSGTSRSIDQNPRKMPGNLIFYNFFPGHTPKRMEQHPSDTQVTRSVL